MHKYRIVIETERIVEMHTTLENLREAERDLQRGISDKYKSL